MKIGYPGTNLGLGCTSSHTFRLAAFTPERAAETITQNLDCLERMLAWNVSHGLMFFRISSNLIPFASHQQNTYTWQEAFADRLAGIGRFVREKGMRISMHPGQFVVINSPAENIYRNSVAELQYHADLFDLMGLDRTHKFQIHIGGLHGNAAGSFELFAERYLRLSESIRRHLVIENDERSASVGDCVRLSGICGIPVLFDSLHHQVKNEGETLLKGLQKCMATWQEDDGVPMIDYSNQNPDKKIGAHAQTLDVEKFRSFVRSLRGREIDIMFEIKNKEASALQAQLVIENL